MFTQIYLTDNIFIPFRILPITGWVIITLFISFDQSQLHVFHHISVTNNRLVAILP
jgi:hypothetical protein